MAVTTITSPSRPVALRLPQRVVIPVEKPKFWVDVDASLHTDMNTIKEISDHPHSTMMYYLWASPNINK